MWRWIVITSSFLPRLRFIYLIPSLNRGSSHVFIHPLFTRFILVLMDSSPVSIDSLETEWFHTLETLPLTHPMIPTWLIEGAERDTVYYLIIYLINTNPFLMCGCQNGNRFREFTKCLSMITNKLINRGLNSSCLLLKETRLDIVILYS